MCSNQWNKILTTDFEFLVLFIMNFVFLNSQFIFINSAVIDELQPSAISSLTNGAHHDPNNPVESTTTNALTDTFQNVANQLANGNPTVEGLGSKTFPSSLLENNPVGNIPMTNVKEFETNVQNAWEKVGAIPNVLDGQIYGKDYGLNSLLEAGNDGKIYGKNYNVLPSLIGGNPLQTRSYGGGSGYGAGFGGGFGDEDEDDDDGDGDDDFMTRSKKKKKKKKKCGGGGGYGGGYGG